MSIFEKTNPLEPLLWINNKPLITLTYLWHLTQEGLDNKEKYDLLWKLTRQLIIAEKHKNTISIDSTTIQEQLTVLAENELIQSLLQSEVMSSEYLEEILLTQEIYFQYLVKTQKDIEEKLALDDSQLQEHYEQSETQFTRQNVFEIYKCQLIDTKTIPDNDIVLLDDLKKYGKDIIWLGAFTKEEIEQEIEQITKQKYSLPSKNPPYFISINKEKKEYFFVAAFYSEYKANYAQAKGILIKTLAENALEFAIEDEAQELLDSIELKYNEEALQKINDYLSHF